MEKFKEIDPRVSMIFVCCHKREMHMWKREREKEKEEELLSLKVVQSFWWYS